MGFRASILKKIVPAMIINGYGVPMELLLRAQVTHPFAMHRELPHPARYDIKVESKYSVETYAEKGDRLSVAFQALVRVLHDIGIDAEQFTHLCGSRHQLFRSLSSSKDPNLGEVYHPVYGVLK
jgi:hypothetical protein